MDVMDLHPPALGWSTPDRHGPDAPTPAALVSGEVSAADAPHPLSVFDMFRIGIGPSSSHTVGPMRAGLAFAAELAADADRRDPQRGAPARVTVELFGSLGATGRGHNTDRAVLLGLAGHDPETVPIDVVESILPSVARTGRLVLAGGSSVPFDIGADIRFLPRVRLPYHVNALRISAWWRRPGEVLAGAADASSGDPASPGPIGDGGPAPLLSRTYYSVGGGFVMAQTNDDPDHPEVTSLATPDVTSTMHIAAPYPFATAEELLDQCARSGLSLAQVVRANEESARPAGVVEARMDRIADAMLACIEEGASATGILPGGLDVPRRAHALRVKLDQRITAGGDVGSPGSHAWASTPEDPMRAMDWVNLFALAVNEENAAGHRVVTAPTNGAAGVVPAVLGYLVTYCPEAGVALPHAAPGTGAALFPFRLSPTRASGAAGTGDGTDWGTDRGDATAGERTAGPPSSTGRPPESGAHWEVAARRRRAVHDFLLAATAIGALIKTNASIAGAEVGCQGEVGSASAMAAAGLAQALGGTPHQVENAAEIAMEHSLGLTCDPVGGLVQIPCIERNAIAAVKAINSARMALWGDGRHTVSLDVVIETMRQTGNDMLSKYKETSAGGLAVNVVEC